MKDDGGRLEVGPRDAGLLQVPLTGVRLSPSTLASVDDTALTTSTYETGLSRPCTR